MMKTCTKCGSDKDVEDFSRKSASKDGRRSECKTCVSVGGVVYREKHKDEAKTYNAAYRSLHKQEEQDRHSRWYAEHKTEVSIRDAKRYHDHRDEKLLYLSSYRSTHKAQAAINSAIWRKTNPDKVRAISHRCRAQRCGASGDCSAADWKIVTSILGSVCIHPNSDECHGMIHQDHVKPLAKGGSNHPTNRQPLCEHHNTSKGAKWIDYRTPSQIRRIMAAFQMKLFEVAS